MSNSQTERVLVIRLAYGEIESITDETRSVYTNTKGRFIKTVSDGNIFLNEHNHAYIAYRNEEKRMRDGRLYRFRRKYMPTTAEVEQMLHTMFLNHGLDGFIK